MRRIRANLKDVIETKMVAGAKIYKLRCTRAGCAQPYWDTFPNRGLCPDCNPLGGSHGHAGRGIAGEPASEMRYDGRGCFSGKY
jgi:hypothetical protein